MTVYSPPPFLPPSLSALFTCFPSCTQRKAGRPGETMQPAPIRRQWCAELCSPPLNPAVNLAFACECVCASTYYRVFSARPKSLVYRVQTERPCSSVLSIWSTQSARSYKSVISVRTALSWHRAQSSDAWNQKGNTHSLHLTAKCI